MSTAEDREPTGRGSQRRWENTSGVPAATPESTRRPIVEFVRGLRRGTAWQARANCLGVDPDLFFPARGASVREAKRTCAGCEVRVECLEYALSKGEKFGIWGGLSERERRRVRRLRREEAS